GGRRAARLTRSGGGARRAVRAPAGEQRVVDERVEVRGERRRRDRGGERGAGACVVVRHADREVRQVRLGRAQEAAPARLQAAQQRVQDVAVQVRGDQRRARAAQAPEGPGRGGAEGG